MRIPIFIFVLMTSFLAFAQEAPEVNDKLVINEPAAYDFAHLDLPKANILIKRAVVPNYAALDGVEVVVTEVAENGKVVLKRADGKNFFRYYPAITAHYDEAVRSGELRQL